MAKPFPHAVQQELRDARKNNQWPQPPSHFHAHGVLLKQVDDFWEVIKSKNPDKLQALKQLVQIGAMAQRAAEELGLIDDETIYVGVPMKQTQ